MESIFILPLFLLAALQLVFAASLLVPAKAVRLPIARLVSSTTKNPAANAVQTTLALVLVGLLVSCVTEVARAQERATPADTREVVATIDFLRAQVSGCLCAINLLLLFLSRALAAALCAEDRAVVNLDAMRRQVKGLQAEYDRATSQATSKAGSAAQDKSAGSIGGLTPGEANGLKRQVDRLIAEKTALQVELEGAVKAKATAEASVTAMKSQLKGFDNHFDLLLDENKALKRKLVAAGDQTYAADAAQGTWKGKKDS